jgi:uncharacterized protein YkuJ
MKPTEEICKLAVYKNGLVLAYVKEEFQTEEICKLAVYQNSDAIQFNKMDLVYNMLKNHFILKKCVS